MKLTREEFNALKKRESKMFVKIYNACKKDVFNFIMIKCSYDKTLAEEIFSLTMCSAYESVVNLKNANNLLQWLMCIASNKYNDYLRGLYRDKKIINIASSKLSDNPPKDLATAIDEKEKLRLLYLALKRLKPDYRKIIMYKVFDGLSHTQIAEKMNKSRDAAESLFQRALGAVKKECFELSKVF